MGQDKLTAFFHQPFGSTGSATNSHSIHILEPVEVDFIGTFYLITVGVHAMTFLEEHLAVGTLASAHKEHEVVLGSKAGYIRHSVCHLSADGVKTLEKLAKNDKILIAEGCTHHRQKDDIGTVKIPKWLKEYTGVDLTFDWVSGGQYPANLAEYKLIIHCGACMLNRREVLYRNSIAKEQNVPIVNYGILIAYLKGILPRVIKPFQ